MHRTCTGSYTKKLKLRGSRARHESLTWEEHRARQHLVHGSIRLPNLHSDTILIQIGPKQTQKLSVSDHPEIYSLLGLACLVVRTKKDV